jgi:hypothetical protein
MNKPLVIQRFVPAKGSTTSDSQVGMGSITAELSNLAAIMRNNTVVFEGPTTLVTTTVDIPTEEDAELSNG